MIDLQKVRADTHGCDNVVHFNNAGSSLMPEPVYRAVLAHLALERDIGGYEAEARAAPLLDRFYTGFAELLGAQPDEIAYVENATRAWDMAFYALPLEAGDRIITHSSEYASNYLAFLHSARRRGLCIDVAPSHASGQIDIDGLRAMIGPRTRVIAITHVPSQGGLVNPAPQVGEVARQHGLIYLLDACQSVGQIAVDVNRIGCDILSGTGRKFLRGPRGTGFLYVRSDLIERLEPPFIDLHAASWTAPDRYAWAAGARRFETFESNVAGRIGLARAVDYLMALDIDAVQSRVTELAQTLRDKLAAVSGITVRDRGRRLCGIVTFTSSRATPARIAAALAARRINISVTPSSYAQLDLGRRGIDALARASLHYYNSDDEIDRCVDVLTNL